MSIRADMSIVEVAFEVGTALAEAGATAVLSGGGAAATYAPEAYQTQDLDFILQSARAKVDPVIGLGFRSRGRSGMYEHPDIPFTLEFPAGPLAVGDDVIREWSTLRDGDLQLNILSPTDCVRDRLAAAIHWRDEKSINQALAVAKLHPVDLAKVGVWCQTEGGEEVFATFAARLGRAY
jgi:hypothetical protein